jgi:predicted component of type VI protein secretion system
MYRMRIACLCTLLFVAVLATGCQSTSCPCPKEPVKFSATTTPQVYPGDDREATPEEFRRFKEQVNKAAAENEQKK